MSLPCSTQWAPTRPNVHLWAVEGDVAPDKHAIVGAAAVGGGVVQVEVVIAGSADYCDALADGVGYGPADRAHLTLHSRRNPPPTFWRERCRCIGATLLGFLRKNLNKTKIASAFHIPAVLTLDGPCAPGLSRPDGVLLGVVLTVVQPGVCVIPAPMQNSIRLML